MLCLLNVPYTCVRIISTNELEILYNSGLINLSIDINSYIFSLGKLVNSFLPIF